jgi:hypothetical protein
VTVSSDVKNLVLRGAIALAAVASAGCPSASSPDSSRPDAAEKWLRRAQQDYQTCDVDEARDSIAKALAIVPGDPDVQIVAARIALARLDYDEVLRQVKEVRTSEAAGLRGRALWYKGELEAAADELEAMLNDPDVKDDWAKAIAKLARRGAGRTPFATAGGLLAAVEMPHVSPSAPFFVVPLEIDGEAGLALISTGNAEVVLDSATRPEPSWVSLRFGERFEVRDVPALSQDLSGISKELGAPVRALLGVNVLRHVNATLDYFGRQFVVRSFTAPPPPSATRVDLCYARGGGMVLRSGFDGEKGPKAALLVDTAMEFPIALDAAGWKKAGVDVAGLRTVPQAPNLKEGVVGMLRLGAFDVPKVPGIFGAPVDNVEKLLQLDLDGVVGAGLLAQFRLTLGDGGRVLWFEDNASLAKMLQQAPPPPAAPAAAPPANVAAPAPTVAPAAPPPPKKGPPPAKKKPKP